jgi:glucosyl-3-phosphoglycerate synthase
MLNLCELDEAAMPTVPNGFESHWHSNSCTVSVIIPALNEAETIASFVEFANRSPLVDEVIVVDDGSIDGTPELAAAAGVRGAAGPKLKPRRSAGLRLSSLLLFMLNSYAVFVD